VAAAAGVVALCEPVAAPAPVPPFVLGGNRYDQTTFQGRLTSIMEMIDMRTLLTTDAELDKAQALLAECKKLGRNPDGASDAEMWDAQRLVGAIVHGPTGETMFIGGRMSMFVPMNVPIATGLLMSKTVYGSVFWQWFNQTYNVVNNYVNRAGPTVEMGPLFQSYVLAVTSACGVAIGAGKLLAAFPSLTTFGPFVPYLATITAGSANVGFSRMDEVRNGIDVFDAEGNNVGRSIAAGQTAVFRTVTTRSMFLPVFPLLIPPTTMKLALGAGVLTAGSPVAIIFEVSLIAMCMGIGLPVALAMQPLMMELPVSGLEPQFQSLKDSKGEPITAVFASKGM